ncbi:MAG: purine-binding chemotaxis protein CheW [Deltaproteobacteria bacterium]|nr:purine-binding chemotaxis protein CheW [Deltaproteobacteria bacterium]
MRHVVFRIGSERYGLPLATVREVVTPTMTSQVPRAPAAIRGIMNLRGRVVTVVDLAALLQIPAGSAPDGGKVVILNRGRRDLGLLVTGVDGIHTLDDVATAPGESLPSVHGVARHANGAVTVLDDDGLEKQILSLVKQQSGR